MNEKLHDDVVEQALEENRMQTIRMMNQKK